MCSSDVMPFLSDRAQIMASGSLLEQMSAAARLVTVFSTLAYEGLVLKVPVILLVMGDASVRDAFPPHDLLEMREA